MGNPELDQFMQALIWKAAPVIFIAGIAGIFLREFLQWLERRAVRFGRERRAAQARRAAESSTRRETDSGAGPHCPTCNGLMGRRVAKRGTNAGSEFWGCFGYPRCRGTREA